MRLWLRALVLLSPVLLLACNRTFSGSATQPNPIAQPLETLRTSERVTIVTGDMDLEVPDPPLATQRASIVHNNRWPLINQAYFAVISRDRLRFHVQVDHKWQEWADLKGWSVDLEDDAGRRWLPESTDRSRVTMMTVMWDREIQTAQRNRFGDVVALNNDGWKNRQSLGSLSVYRGRADFSFYARGSESRPGDRSLLHAGTRWLRLTIRRDGTAFVFTWRFDDIR